MTDTSSQDPARKNVLVVAAVLAGLAAWNVYRRRPVYSEVLGGMALTLCIVVLCSRSWTGRINRGWMALARALGYLNSRVLLSLLFYVVLAPYGALLRLIGHDPLHRRGGKRDSYWIPRQCPNQSRNQFERPF